MGFPSAGGIICHLNLLLYTCLSAPKCLWRTHITFIRRKKGDTPKICFHLGKYTCHHGSHESGDKKKIAGGTGYQGQGIARGRDAGRAGLQPGERWEWRRGGGKGGPGGGRPQRGPSCPLPELSPSPTSHPKSVIPPTHPVRQFSGALALKGVDAWVVSGEAATSGPGDGRGANQPIHDLSTLNSSARLWTCLLIMPEMWMKYRRLFKFKFQINNG